MTDFSEGMSQSAAGQDVASTLPSKWWGIAQALRPLVASTVERARPFWMAHAPFWLICVAYILVTQVTSRIYDYPIDLGLYRHLTLYSGFLGVTLIIGLTVYVLISARFRHPLTNLWQKFFVEWKSLSRLAMFACVFAATSPFMSAFSATKTAIDRIVPFYLDDTLVNIDHMVLGQDAWQLLQPILGYPAVTFFLNVNYNIWGIITYGTFLGAALMLKRQQLRAQYLISFVMSWIILGSGLAIMLSSVGPCFYEAIYGSDRFTGLMNYLTHAGQEYPIWALATQDYLLFKYEAGMVGIGSGISAMPSMHLAMTSLMTIFAFKINRKLGYVSLVYLGIIYLGSIHLGWHYASDGIVSMALVPAIWWVSGHIARLPYGMAGEELEAQVSRLK